MMKKVLALSLACACNMSYATEQKPQAQTARPTKVRMVTLSDRDVAAIKHAYKLATTGGATALVEKYAMLVDQGTREIERNERNQLMNEVYEQIGRKIQQVI